MPYERCLYARVQLVLGTHDEDGNLTGTRVWPAADRLVEVYYPFSARVQELIDRCEREAERAIPERER